MQKIFKKNHKKIGILGGTFDPAHIGHIKISREAKKKFKLDYIIWALTKKNPNLSEGESIDIITPIEKVPHPYLGTIWNTSTAKA